MNVPETICILEVCNSGQKKVLPSLFCYSVLFRAGCEVFSWNWQQISEKEREVQFLLVSAFHCRLLAYHLCCSWGSLVPQEQHFREHFGIQKETEVRNFHSMKGSPFVSRNYSWIPCTGQWSSRFA